jgi:hypothetical protein
VLGEQAADCRYNVNMKANNGEPVFLSEKNVWLFGWTVSEEKELYAFEIRGLRFGGAIVSFFIKPAATLGESPAHLRGTSPYCLTFSRMDRNDRE